MSSPALLLPLPVLVSLIFTIVSTENPARVPFRRVFLRSLPGMLLFIAFWLPFCFLGYELLAYLFDLESSIPVRTCILILTGLIVPQAGRLKDAFLTPRAAKYFSLLQVIDEQTRLYVGRIINREERKVNTTFMAEDCERRRRALDRLFEEYNLEIAREEAKKRHPPEIALNIFKIRHPAVKFKYLLHYFGYSECLRVLRTVAARPEIILPAWPSDQGDRRGSGSGLNDTTAGPRPSGRRKYEHAYVQAYVLDIAGTKIKKKYQVFISSTFLDLREERQQTLRGLLAAECIPAGMEFFPSSDEELWTLIRDVLDDCDYYLLLIGSRYGSTTREGVSYTEAEYDYAVRSGKPVLAFLHASPAAIPRIEEEGPEKRARLQEFRERVCRTHAPGYWSRPEELPFLVQQAVERAKRSSLGVGWVRYERPQG
jgi:hypothetical protein